MRQEQSPRRDTEGTIETRTPFKSNPQCAIQQQQKAATEYLHLAVRNLLTHSGPHEWKTAALTLHCMKLAALTRGISAT